MPWAFFTRQNRISRRNKRKGKPQLPGIRENCIIHNHGADFSDSDDDEVVVVPKPKPTKPKPAAEIELKVKKHDYNVEKNTIEHHTDEFDITEKQERNDGRKQQLVLRRGQPFNITLELTRPFDAAKDDLRFIFEFDSNFYNSHPLQGTLVELILSAKDEPLKWGAKIEANTGNSLTIKVFTPPTLCVGKWKCMVDAIKKSADTRSKVDRYHCKEPIYMLFNPWCKDDTVYLNSELHRDEYVLNENGKIFCGYWKSFSCRCWTFGQGDVLDCVMYMLDELKPMDAKYRGDPILVSRKLSALVNSIDEDGVLAGNWSGDYSGGVAPCTWTGSVKILEDFYRTKTTVRYGQCWVFSGVLTTVCRAIGIPARSVTNFCSAHDTDANIIIETVVPEIGDDVQIDSIWNFHVWNDVWMARPDLPDGYDGWQALDATPQEETEEGLFSGLSCCGPCPVKAIRAGEVLMPYDAAFIFAEVNADQVYWKYSQEEGKMKKIMMHKNKIGKYISTCLPKGLPDKIVDSSMPCNDKRWEDITSEYKHPEGSPLERLAVKCAVQAKMKKDSNLIEDLYGTEIEDVEFEFEDIGLSMIGSDFEVKLKINNTSKDSRTAVGYIGILTKFYTGKIHKVVKSERFEDVKLSPKTSKTVTVKVSESEYTDCLTEQCIFEFREMFTIKETGQTSYEDVPFKLEKPTINITAPNNGKVAEPIKVEVSFVNPLKVALTGCMLGIQGAGLFQPISYRRGNVGPSGTFHEMFVVTPKKKGERKLVVNFNANEIEMVEGDHDFKIE